MANMKFINCNVQKLEATMTSQMRQSFDVISHDSCSWKTREASTRVPVTGMIVGRHTLPAIRILRRVREKTNQACVRTSNRFQGNASAEAERDGIVAFVKGIIPVLNMSGWLLDADSGRRLFDMLPHDIRERSLEDAVYNPEAHLG